jgi:hypothetical protein
MRLCAGRRSSTLLAGAIENLHAGNFDGRADFHIIVK